MVHLVHSPGTLVRNSTLHSPTTALVVVKSDHVRVSNCSFSNAFVGMEVVDSSSGQVVDSTFGSTSQGIVSRNSSLSISQCSFTLNQVALLASLGSNLSTSDSLFHHNQGDVYVADQSFATFWSNSFTGSLEIEFASATFRSNSFTDSQVTFFQSFSLVLTDNTFSGGVVQVLAGVDDLLSNNSFNDTPLILRSTSNVSVDTNQWVFSTTATGLGLTDSSGVINDNSFTNSGVGVLDGLFSPHAYQFNDNRVNSLRLGFFTDLNSTVVSEPFGQLILLTSTNITISNQSIHSTAPAAVQVLDSTEVTVGRSSFANNLLGLSLTNTTVGEVSYNNFTGQVGYAVALARSSNITLHHNSFDGNNLSGVQVLDEGVNNTWHFRGEGNYWSDLSGRASYPTDGSAGSVDVHPLLVPSSAPPSKSLVELPSSTMTTAPLTNTTDTNEEGEGGEEGLDSLWMAPTVLGSVLFMAALGLVVLIKGFSFSFKIGR